MPSLLLIMKLSAWLTKRTSSIHPELVALSGHGLQDQLGSWHCYKWYNFTWFWPSLVPLATMTNPNLYIYLSVYSQVPNFQKKKIKKLSYQCDFPKLLFPFLIISYIFLGIFTLFLNLLRRAVSSFHCSSPGDSLQDFKPGCQKDW